MDLAGYQRGLELFNHREFYDAHEVLEDVWRAAPNEEKKFLQGLIQLAVGLHHHSTGNVVGARSLLARGAKNLSGYPQDYGGLDLPALQRSVAAWTHALAENRPVPDFPRAEQVKSQG